MTASQLLGLIVAAVVTVLVVVLLTTLVRRRRQRTQLREAFGPEYDRTVQGSGKRRHAERELAERKQRHDALELRPLSAASRQRFLAAWDGVQSRFVDQPVLALSEADHLVTRVMAERGYPTDGARAQAEMLSVEHGRVLEDFRAGHAIEQVNRTGHSDTEQVRQGMLHFRTVFEALVSDGAGEPYPADDARARTSVPERR